jgi:predicted acetyltransferase
MALLRLATPADRSEFKSLLLDHLTELSELVDGNWDHEEYPFLDVLWSEPGRHPLFIRSSEANVGFAIVRDAMSTGTGVHDLAEFYLRTEHRGTGLATRAAHTIFLRFPGRWELQVHTQNERADRFWARCIEEVSITPPRIRDLDLNGELKKHYLFEVS